MFVITPEVNSFRRCYYLIVDTIRMQKSIYNNCYFDIFVKKPCQVVFSIFGCFSVVDTDLRTKVQEARKRLILLSFRLLLTFCNCFVNKR